MFVGDHADAGSVHVAEHVLDLADKLLLLVVDHSGQKGNFSLVDIGDQGVFARV